MRSLVLGLIFPAFCVAQASGPRFTLTDLGTLPNMGCTPTALSQNGTVAGICTTLGAGLFLAVPSRGFLYKNGALTDLGTAPQTVTVPLGVNDLGTVVGTIGAFGGFGSTFSGSPFSNQNGSVQQIPGAPGNYYPFAILNSGLLAGTLALSVDPNSLSFTGQAATLMGSTLTKLPSATGSQTATTQSVAFGMSAGGVIAGASTDVALNTVIPTVWNGTTATALAIPSGYPFALADSVNDNGQAAGVAYSEITSPTTAQVHAVMFSGSTATDLGSLPGYQGSVASGINNSGWVVGFASFNAPIGGLNLFPLLFAPTSQKAVLWVNGTIYDLNTLVTNAGGFTLDYATAINNAGQIVGTGYINQSQHAFLLTPVPSTAPAIAAVVGAGLSVPSVKSVSPNGIFSIFGSNFAPAGTARGLTGSDIVNNTLPTSLAGVCVEAGGQRAGLFFVGSGQINALFEAPMTSGSVQVSVLTNCGTATEVDSGAATVSAAGAAPEFLYWVQNQNGVDPVVAINANTGAQVGPAGLITGVNFAPAHVGDTLTIYAVGLGPTTPPVTAGGVAVGAANVSGASVTIGGVAADVLYAGISPGSYGLYQVNLMVPSVPVGNQPIVLKLGNGTTTPTGPFLAISQ